MSYPIDTYSFEGKRALIRVDFNVPLDENLKITDDTRIRAAAKTIQKITSEGGRAILMSHLGRPKKGPEDKFSLKHIVYKVSEILGKPVAFSADCVGDKANEAVDAMNDGDVLLLENLRFYKEEEEGDEFFAGELAENGDVYVNDAFGTAHRAHASTAIIARFFPEDKLFGYLMEEEMGNIEKVLKDPEKPVTAIIGGSKVSSKIAVMENLLNMADNIVVGGGMAFTFIKALGGGVGSSLIEEDKLETALSLLEKAKEKNVKIILPSDVVTGDRFAEDATVGQCNIKEIPDGQMGLDIGPKSIEEIKDVISNSRTILWNGPMGVFEWKNFANGTSEIAQAIAAATQAGTCYSLVGGGDSVAALNEYKLADKVSYVSTGGGAMLESLEGTVLPGIAAIRED
ncbi:MAG: phosphoglycerate kinase [Flavobacteriales bacterium]|nr:phosphoglycerate kinase [Flavobacteriales bacterium]